MGPKGTGPAVEAGKGEEWFDIWRRKEVTKKELPTGFDRGASDVECSKSRSTRQGKIRQKRSRGVQMQGLTGTY